MPDPLATEFVDEFEAVLIQFAGVAEGVGENGMGCN